MNFDFDTPVERRGTFSSKWSRYADKTGNNGEEIIPLWLADMDFQVSPAIREALRRDCEHGVFGYSNTPQELIDTVCSYLKKEHDWEIDPDWLLWLPGARTGLALSCLAFAGEGETVATFTPIYPPFLHIPKETKRNVLALPLKEDNQFWTIDFAALEQAFKKGVSLLLLCNPHNPVGRVFTRQELAQLSEICLANDVIVCSDEHHSGIILDEDKRHCPLSTISPEIAARTLTLMGPGKSFNISGLQISFAVISDQMLRQRFKESGYALVSDLPLPAYSAALAGYKDSTNWLKALITYLRGNRDLVEEFVKTRLAPVTVTHVEGTYLSWLDMRALALEDPSEFFEDAGVGLFDGEFFGLPGFLRLNFACPRNLLLQALERMEIAVADFRR